MTPDKPTEAPNKHGTERKLIRIRGVRAAPGGWVWMNELIDGWATFPDRSAGGRRLQWLIAIIAVILIPVDVVVTHFDLAMYEGVVSLAIIAMILLFVVVGNLTDSRREIGRWRARNQSMLRAGGKQAFRTAVRTHGRARTVGEMNILLSSMGRTDPVFSKRRIVKSTVDSRWWRTRVVLDLTDDHKITYQVYGMRAPARLAQIFEPGKV